MRFSIFLALSACTSAQVPATFTEVYNDILFPSCGFSSCHGGSAGAPYLSDAEQAYESLVDAESKDKSGAILVRPGDPDNSYLIQKLEDAPDIEGDAMPPSFSMDPEIIERVRSWIEDGALKN